MTQNYIGCKKVLAYPQENDGRQGYGVTYPDGYVSWSPKEVFEQAYLPIGNENKITIDIVKNFIKTTEVTKIGEKTTLIRAILANGYELIEYSSCVDPKNYDEELGTQLAMKKIEDKVWMLLGFLLQTANNGVKTMPIEQPKQGFTPEGEFISQEAPAESQPSESEQTANEPAIEEPVTV